MKNTEKTMDKIVALCKNRGFVYPGSEIYGGLANSWDYGPLGVELKNNVKRAWWQKFVQENPYNVGLDSAILMNPQVWVASGHVTTFNDPLIDCKSCKMRHRADKLIEGWLAENPMPDVNVEAMTNDEMVAFIRAQQIPCPGCGKSDFTDIRKFNLMFKTHQGVTEDTAADRQELPQRDHAGQLHLPHPRVRADGAGVLLRAGHGSGVVRLLAQLLPRVAQGPAYAGREPPPARP